MKNWKRYADVDGDGIGWRTLPGTNHPLGAYFTRGTGHNDAAGYSERPEDWSENLERLYRKHDTARTLVPAPVIDAVADAEIGIISYGTNDPAVQEARDRLAKTGVKTSYLRVRALPLEDTLIEFIKKHPRVLRGGEQLRRPDASIDSTARAANSPRASCRSPSATACRSARAGSWKRFMEQER